MNLSQLKKAFEPISQIGHLRRDVEVFGLSITLRTLTVKEDAEVQRTLSVLREEEDTTTVEYLDSFRKETLSRGIIKVGDLNLEEEYVETGEVLDNGTPVKIKKIEAISDILDTFSRAVLGELFTLLTNLTTEAEEEVKKLSPTTKNVEEEVEELKSRITDLENFDNVISSDETVKDLPNKVGQYTEALQDMDK
tara:strand:+ start:501 stop:1082 length:582 start_codon:yes stop_codon:yes gene_type:complete